VAGGIDRNIMTSDGLDCKGVETEMEKSRIGGGRNGPWQRVCVKVGKSGSAGL